MLIRPKRDNIPSASIGNPIQNQICDNTALENYPASI